MCYTTQIRRTSACSSARTISAPAAAPLLRLCALLLTGCTSLARVGPVFQRIVEDLLEATGAFRAVLRVNRPGENFPVVAEALGPGATSDAAPLPYDLREVETVKFLMREKRILVQNDTRQPPSPPREMIEEEGIGAQMLAPLLRDGELIGVIALHHRGGPREWSPDDVAALEHAVERVHGELSKGT